VTKYFVTHSFVTLFWGGRAGSVQPILIGKTRTLAPFLASSPDFSPTL
jgi:hypothetical protein